MNYPAYGYFAIRARKSKSHNRRLRKFPEDRRLLKFLDPSIRLPSRSDLVNFVMCHATDVMGAEEGIVEMIFFL